MIKRLIHNAVEARDRSSERGWMESKDAMSKKQRCKDQSHTVMPFVRLSPVLRLRLALVRHNVYSALTSEDGRWAPVVSCTVNPTA